LIFFSVAFAVGDCCIVTIVCIVLQFGSSSTLENTKEGKKKSMKVTLVVSCYTSVPSSSDIPYFSEISSTFFVVFCPVSAVISGRGAVVSPSGLAVEISVVPCSCPSHCSSVRLL